MEALADNTFRRIAELMQASVGLFFPESKKPLISSRLSTRIQKLGLRGFDDYVDLIMARPDEPEFQVAVDLLTTNETYFFREPAHFDVLERALTRERPSTVAAWSAASSFGDEAYSIAILLADLHRQGAIGADWSVLGTDISDRALRAASEGVYPEERLRSVDDERRRRYCLRGAGDSAGFIRMHERLRARVRFGWSNLYQALDELGRFDVVFLRNVLIYFDAATKRDVVDRVLAQLRPGGLLFIGTAEGRVACGAELETLAPGAFRKVG